MRLEVLWHDVRFAWRSAARQPGFTALVVLTLALGIGVNSAVFALLDGVLLRPLPYPEPSKLMFVWQTLPEHSVFELEATPFDFARWRGLRSFSAVALVASDAYTLSGDDHPERVRGSRVSASLMPLLGIAPRMGRAFSADEDADGSTAVAILSDGLWRRRYGADPRILGRGISVDGVMHAVVGVMAPDALLPGHLAGNAELWLPMRMSAAERENSVSHNYTILARLAEGATVTGASAELEASARRTSAEYPDSHAGLGARLVPVEELTVRGIRPTLLVVWGGVGLLLLVACANAVTLLMARAANRWHETAVRAALGATQSRLLSQAVAESLIVAVLGGLAGLALGGWVLRTLVPLFEGSLPASALIEVDLRVALFTAALSLVLGAAFGIVVAAHRPARLADPLKMAPRTATAGGPTARIRNLLVVAQIALAVILLSAAGLMLTRVARLSRVSPGFDADHLLTFKLSLNGSGYDAAPRRTAFADQLIERLKSRPGVDAAALTSILPFSGMRGADGVELEGRPATRGESIIVDQRHVTPAYFETMRIPLIHGRTLAPADDSQAEPVVVVNRVMAGRYWPGESPIDRRVRLTVGSGPGAWIRVVGVVDNVRHVSLDREPVAEMYRPYAQAASGTFTVVIRAAGDPAAAASAARDAVAAIDPALPLYDIRTMAHRVAGSYAQTRGAMWTLLATALLATALAAVAIYGSVWYAVGQRIPEIGIRLALGATRGSLVASIVGRALAMAATGAALGTAAAVAAGPLLKSLLVDTPTSDPATYAAVVAAVLGLTAAASILPARRAMRVDPMVTLRNE